MPDFQPRFIGRHRADFRGSFNPPLPYSSRRSSRNFASVIEKSLPLRRTQCVDSLRLENAEDVPAYSVLSALMGLIQVARRAGRKQAMRAAVVSKRLAAISAKGSLGLTS